MDTNKLNDFNFSVSMCVYGKDNPDWFKVAVDSIINQTLKPNEIVLVVDGPVPENLNKIILEYESNSLFNVIRLEENKGHGIARDTGLENCKYDLVALMDADDISVSDRFEKQIELFKNNPELTIVGSYISEFTEDPNNPISIRDVKLTHDEIKEDLKERCPMNQVTVMFKKSHVDKVGGFIDWFCEEDYYLWIRLIEAGYKFANAKEILVNVRVNPDMYNRRGGWKYFQSEKRVQDYMLSKNIINKKIYCKNLIKRYIVQMLLPNSLREAIFNKFARKSVISE